jgi:geranylgeranyl reductase family protein
VTPRTLGLAGVSNGLVINRLKGVVIHSPTGKTLTLGGDKVRAIVIDRAGLDRALAQQAQEAGAMLALGTRVDGLDRFDGHVRLHLQHNGSLSRLDARLAIGADGTRSVIAGRNGNRRPPQAVVLMGAEVEQDSLDEEFVHVYLGRDVAPGWFGWLIPLDGRRARVGVGAAEPGHRLHMLFKNLLGRKELQEARILRMQGGLIPLAAPRRPYADNVLLVGDAAGHVKPTSGGGLYPLMVSSRLCAHTAMAALEKDDVSHRVLGEYQRGLDTALGPEMLREQALRRLFVTLTDRDVDAIIEVLQRDAFQRLVLRHGDIDLQGGMFMHLLAAGVTSGAIRELPASLWPRLAMLALRLGVTSAKGGLAGASAR